MCPSRIFIEFDNGGGPRGYLPGQQLRQPLCPTTAPSRVTVKLWPAATPPSCGDVDEHGASLDSCTIITHGVTAVGSTDWMGNLDTYATEEVLVTSTTIDTSTEFTFDITPMDDNAENNAVASGMVNTSVESTNNVRFTLNLDAYPGEVVWAVLTTWATR